MDDDPIKSIKEAELMGQKLLEEKKQAIEAMINSEKSKGITAYDKAEDLIQNDLEKLLQEAREKIANLNSSSEKELGKELVLIRGIEEKHIKQIALEITKEIV